MHQHLKHLEEDTRPNQIFGLALNGEVLKIVSLSATVWPHGLRRGLDFCKMPRRGYVL